MERLPTIVLHKGITSAVDFDLSQIDVAGGEVILTIRKIRDNSLVLEKPLVAGSVYSLVFSKDFTKELETGAQNYCYDVVQIVDDERFLLCATSYITVKYAVGGEQDE